MVTYNQWTEAVHTAYKQMGGSYGGDTATELTSLAAEFWQENKDQLVDIDFPTAVDLAKRALNV